MNTISIRLPEHLLSEIDQRSKDLNISRTEYVRKALVRLNKDIASERRRAHLIQVSQRVRNESMSVNAEFGEVEDDPES